MVYTYTPLFPFWDSKAPSTTSPHLPKMRSVPKHDFLYFFSPPPSFPAEPDLADSATYPALNVPLAFAIGSSVG